ncbi:MAG: hypothetical protein ACYCPS_03265 [Candidatus Saccharimonadales bacterium]
MVHFDQGAAGNGTTASTYNNTGQLTVNGFGLFKNSTNSPSAFQIQNSAGTPLVNVSTLGTNGQVCIGNGTCSGTETLGVFGAAYATGGFSTNSSPDYAEDITATDPNTISAGDIVSEDINNPGQVVLSSKAYDPNLLGAISTSPSFLANASDATNQVKLALVGRIPVNVNTQNGPIAPGDYITSSDTPGVGMKATQAGNVIGIALESYNGSGTGSILVYMEPQYYNPVSSSNLQGTNPTIDSLTVNGVFNLASLTVSGNATFAGNLTVSGITTVADITVNGQVIFNSSEITYNNNIRQYNVSLSAGSSSYAVTFSKPYPDNNYAVLCTPNYDSSCWITGKTDNGFVIHLGSPAPSDGSGSIDWFVAH